MNHTTANPEMEKEAQFYICKSCGKKYIVRKCEVQHSASGSYRHYCVPCQKVYRAKLERERDEQENLIWQKKAADQKLFESLLPAWNVKDLSEMTGGGADKKLDSLRAPKGVELKCIRRTKLMLP